MPVPEKTANLPDVVDDDPNAPDDDADLEDGEENPDFAALLGEEESSDSDEPGADDRKAASKEKTPPEGQETPEPAMEKPPAEPPKVDITPEIQAIINRSIENRLARDREVREKEFERRIFTATGKTLQQIEAEQKQQRVQQRVNELGIDEEQAKAWVETEEENRRLKAEREELQRREQDLAKERATLQRTTAYEVTKKQFLDDPNVDSKVKTLVKRYAADIDAWSNSGEIDFVTSAQVILGSKIADILKNAETATEQKVIRNVSERGKVAPEAPGPTQNVTVPAEVRRMGRNLGLSDKEIAESYAATQRQHRKR